MGTPQATREAMAAAVAGDLDRRTAPIRWSPWRSPTPTAKTSPTASGPAAWPTGAIGGPALEGPGWGSEPRPYQAGDRILLHARVGKGSGPAAQRDNRHRHRGHRRPGWPS